MRYKNLEFRQLGKGGDGRSRRSPEIIAWDINSDHDEFCYTLLWWKKDSEGYYIEFVGARPLKYDNYEELLVMMKYGQAVLDAEFELLSK